MKTILVQGAFDILNWGHIQVFKYLKERGQYLIVALNSDELYKDYKNRRATLPFQQKKEILESIRYVDQVVQADNFSPLQLLQDYAIDAYAVADEWLHTKEEEIAFMKSKGKEIIVLPRFKGVISTSQMKQNVIDEYEYYKTSGDKPKSASDY